MRQRLAAWLLSLPACATIVLQLLLRSHPAPLLHPLHTHHLPEPALTLTAAVPGITCPIHISTLPRSAAATPPPSRWAAPPASSPTATTPTAPFSPACPLAPVLRHPRFSMMASRGTCWLMPRVPPASSPGERLPLLAAPALFQLLLQRR